MWYWLMLVVSVVWGGVCTAKLGVPLDSIACLGVWPILSLGSFILMAVLYVVFIEWWLKEIHPSMGADKEL